MSRDFADHSTRSEATWAWHRRYGDSTEHGDDGTHEPGPHGMTSMARRLLVDYPRLIAALPSMSAPDRAEQAPFVNWLAEHALRATERMHQPDDPQDPIPYWERRAVIADAADRAGSLLRLAPDLLTVENRSRLIVLLATSTS